ncbi:alpha-L-fucosidase [Streptomyces hoynatensis]|uniref:alpha-L-fucosidase n=1 Tax=Streptomyces hoynatensis TaxID=1141874 RepID=A0A3A9Z9M2_9ACTN|nr:alpha-L-fucosidase [Streptomyces hoynatensis]RKN44955.1 alpha-L-fucosidase [Streptomyces hoynatensis]
MTGSRNGPYQANWPSLRRRRLPSWFADAKFGIWSHWGPQSVAMAGDWYARHLYGPYAGTEDFEQKRSRRQAARHRDRYGHPSAFGYKDLVRLWRGEKFDPEALMDRFRRTGARYFVSMAAHCDNVDLWDSLHQPWNSVTLGPRSDIVGRWAAAARGAGLRFGVSMHAGSWTWRWLDAAFAADAEGPRAGVPYDGHLTAEDGRGTWWEGLDPRDLYGPPRRPGDPPTPEFIDNFYARLRDVTDRYAPELVYLDDSRLPFDEGSVCAPEPPSPRGLEFLARYYNAVPEGVVSIKTIPEEDRQAVLLDVERQQLGAPDPHPWQYDTSIGDWFYSIGERYKTAGELVHLLVDTVSKNGCLLLNVPQLPDGSIDEDTEAVLDGIGAWIDVCGAALFGTRPWRVHGEGPTGVAGEKAREQALPYTDLDIRYTCRDETVYAFLMAWPAGRAQAHLTSLGTAAGHLGRPPRRVELLGDGRPLSFEQSAGALRVDLPGSPPTAHAQVLRIE